MCASILLVSTAVGCDMQQDRSTGWRLGTNRMIQFRYQVIGITMGAVMSVILARLFMFQQVYFHKMGDSPDKDVYVLGKDFPRIAEIALETSDGFTTSFLPGSQAFLVARTRRIRVRAMGTPSGAATIRSGRLPALEGV